jgi:CPA2 family monovalent cation:H+ antiporter-2
MVEILILKDIAIIFALSVISLFICHRIKLPSIVGFLLAGLLIGPYGLGLVKSVHEVEILAEIGIVLLLFAIGIEFSIKDLINSKRAVLVGGSLQVLMTITIMFILVRQFNFDPNKSIFVGFLVALSSTAIVLRTLQDRNELFSAHGRVILSILIFQDIIIVPMLIFTPLLSGNTENIIGSMLVLGLKGIAVILAVILLARYVVPHILHQVVRTRSRELFLLSTALICIAVAWSTNELGLSLGLGAFLAGLVVSESEYSYQALEGILPFKIVFTSFFFVSVGMLLNTNQFITDAPAIVGIATLIVIIKTILVIGVALLLGMSSRSAIIVGLALSQVGEFSFILSKAGISSNLLDQNIYQIFLAVAILTMAVTPLLINVAPRIADLISGWPFFRIFRHGSYRHLAEETKLRTLKGHLVIIGFGVNGKNIARAARSSNIPYVIIEMNPDTVRSKRKEGEPILYGDATGREALEQAAIDQARIAVVAISDPVGTRRITRQIHELNPNAYIIVRTRFVSEMLALYELGANEVIPEEFETSVEIFTRVLMKYLVPRDDIEEFINEIRSQSYEMFRGLYQQASTLQDLQTHLPEIEISAIRLGKDSPIVGKTIDQAQIRTKFGVNILAIVRDQKLTANPESSHDLKIGDVLYIIGPHDCCSKASRGVSGPK